MDRLVRAETTPLRVIALMDRLRHHWADRLVRGQPTPLRVIALMDRLRHQWAGSLSPRRADAPSGDRADGSVKASVSMDRLVRGEPMHLRWIG